MSRTLMPHTYDLETLRALHAGGASAATEPAIPTDVDYLTGFSGGKWTRGAATRTRFTSSSAGKSLQPRRGAGK